VTAAAATAAGVRQAYCSLLQCTVLPAVLPLLQLLQCGAIWSVSTASGCSTLLVCVCVLHPRIRKETCDVYTCWVVVKAGA
jgi:hypothetical protein